MRTRLANPGRHRAAQTVRFPGQRKELENVLERAFTLCDADQIDAGDLHLGNGVQTASSPTQVIAEGEANDDGTAPVPDGEIDLENYLENIEKTSHREGSGSHPME